MFYYPKKHNYVFVTNCLFCADSTCISSIVEFRKKVSCIVFFSFISLPIMLSLYGIFNHCRSRLIFSWCFSSMLVYCIPIFFPSVLVTAFHSLFLLLENYCSKTFFVVVFGSNFMYQTSTPFSRIKTAYCLHHVSSCSFIFCY